MGHRTSISDYEMDRASTKGPEVEGYDVEADREKPAKSQGPVTKSKVVEPEKDDEPKKSTARTKAK
jgi:hypothetical protein